MAEIPDREASGLVKAAKSMKLTSGKIVIWDPEEKLEKDGIELQCVPIWSWLGKPAT